ncbi:acyl- thioesterase ii [Fusarium agapanthi]|uniref:Acyl- thioesterase ii n=1 Tax=Fusarium agapanthi TaxID=1803897 RepID=A0A9P5E9U9_9HYPO|nr:acyl- thioesterase ii [Fusarium agapanthi]
MGDQSLAHSHGTAVPTEVVTEMLHTPWSDVHRISPDGQKYISPQCLIGTPVQKITEDSDYWMPRWLSLETYLAQEDSEEKKKRDSKEHLRLDPHNKDLAKKHKLHMDNVSKQRKIREIFGHESPYHPNQLVSKHHLPTDGLCEQELMYKLACKVSDLRVLYDKGELAMDPWDFLRWRVSKKIQSMCTMSAQSGKDIIKRIIFSICEDSSSKSASKIYEDPKLRAAIIRSAGYQGRLASFRKPGDKNRITKANTNTVGLGRITHRRSKVDPIPSALSREPALSRSDKRQKRLSQPSTYGGVNAYRAQQQQRDNSKL